MYQFNLNLRWFAKNAKILVVVLFCGFCRGGREEKVPSGTQDGNADGDGDTDGGEGVG